MMGRGPIAQWLLYCADPLGPQSEPPGVHLSPLQVRKLMLKANAHKVLPATLRHFPISAGDAELEREAEARRVEALALSAMLRYRAEVIVTAAKALPVTLVKGPVFADRLYPPGLRPFGDIDLLAAPEAIPQLAPILRAQGFKRVEEGLDPTRLEDKWVHRENEVLMVEVHTNLVHSARMRKAFSLAYNDISGNVDTSATLLAIAIMHGAMHYFAWLRHVVDICQAARALTTATEESRFEALADRTGTRLAAVVGLNLAWRLFGEARCLELARALGPTRNFRFARTLIEGAVITAPMESAIVYNAWRRFIFRELLRHGTLVSARKSKPTSSNYTSTRRKWTV
jgi:hypothetical protein